MVFSKAAKSKYNSNITQKFFYIKVLIGIKIVKLFKKLLFIAYKGKEKNILLVKI